MFKKKQFNGKGNTSRSYIALDPMLKIHKKYKVIGTIATYDWNKIVYEYLTGNIKGV